MKVKAIPSTWIECESYRLDSGPYMSSAIEAKLLLEKLITTPLKQVVDYENGGICISPYFKRVYVNDANHGISLLGNTDILMADLSYPTFLSRKVFERYKKELSLIEGSTLITCFGTVGQMAFCRADMSHCAASTNFMRVVPDKTTIKPGYLFAFLSGKFGFSLVTQKETGSIIPNLLPIHVENLPVPRLGEVEECAHDLMQQSADLLTKYQAGICKATRLFFESVDLKDITAAEWHSWGSDLGFCKILSSSDSLRALNYNPRFQRLCYRIKQIPWKTLGEICIPGTLKRGNRFNRVDAEPDFSYRLIGQKQLFWLKPEGRWIARSSVNNDSLVQQGTILVAARGTLGESELYCRPEFIYGKATEYAYSEDILRVISEESVMRQGCLFAFMRSEIAFRMLRSISIGSKLQDHHYKMLPELPVPCPPRDKQEEIHSLVMEAYKLREKAIELEEKARFLVEKAIEEVAE